MQPLELALSYAGQGWPVFPCRSVDDFDPETGEVLPEKSPLISNGFRGATVNERIIRTLWERNPGAAIGIPTGERTGVWVLDLDIKPNANGHEWLAAMEDKHGVLPYSARVKTANGGTHILFKHVEGVRNRGKLGAGVDVRGEGGYVLAGGSILSDNREYTWIDETSAETIVDAPQWLLDLVLPPKIEQHQAGEWHYEAHANDRYVTRAVQLELDDLASTSPGNRGYQLNASAFALGQFVGAGAIHRSEAEHGLYSAAVTCGLLAKDGEREVLAKIRRGLDAGMAQPRHIPRPEQDNTSLQNVKSMIERSLAKQAAAEKDAAPHSEDPEPASLDTAPPESTQAEYTPPDGADSAQDDAFHATPFAWIDPTTIPRRQFAFGTHYIRKYVSVTVSPGGLGKTSNSIVEALAMVSGKPLTGTQPEQRMNVWLFNAEDPRDEMQRRIMAACLHFGLKPEDINGRLFLDSGREQELVIMQEDKKAGVKVNEPIVEAVVGQIQRNKIDVLIVDPFVSTHRVNENDNGAIDRVAKLWAQIADYTNCAVDVVHHLRKLADREATVEDARGAVSLIGAARSVRVLNRMSLEDANAAGVAAMDRHSYFHIHQGKSNLTKMDTSQHWRKMESVALGNGGKGGLAMLRQDYAGVVTEWRWPTAEKIVEGLTEDQIANIKSVLAGGAYKEAPQGKPWAGEAIAYVLGEDATDRAVKKRLSATLKAMLKEGVLKQVEERDSVSRAVAKIVR